VQRCVVLNQIDLDENKILTKKLQQRLLEQYIGECIDGELLKAIIADISNFYIKRGNITTKPYLKQQSITDGQIYVNVLTGIIAKIVDAKTDYTNTRIKSALITGSSLEL